MPSPPIGRSSIASERSGAATSNRVERPAVVDDFHSQHPRIDREGDVDRVIVGIVVSVLDAVRDEFLDREAHQVDRVRGHLLTGQPRLGLFGGGTDGLYRARDAQRQ